MSILLFIVILVVLVWVHELGHLIAAKMLGIRVDSFNVGFGPRLFGVKLGETDYIFRPVLLGGYVSIYGEDRKVEEGPLPAGMQGRALTAKPRPAQAAVMVAGVLFNVLFAWAVLTAGYVVGLESAIEHKGWGTVVSARPTVDYVLPGSPAEAAGIQTGDVVISLETGHGAQLNLSTLNTDKQAELAHDFLVGHVDESIAIRVDRQGAEKDFVVKAQEGIISGRKALGVELDDIGLLRLPPQLAALQAGIVARDILVAEAQGLGSFFGGIFHGSADLGQVSGPIGIVAQGSALVSQGFGTTVDVIALISINLALINLLPIPGLDGGRLLFIIIEAVIRRPINPRVAMYITLAGMAIVIVFIAVISAHDVSKLVG